MNFTAEQYQASEKRFVNEFTTELKKSFELKFINSFSNEGNFGITFKGSELECLRCYFKNRTYKRVTMEEISNNEFLLTFFEVFTEEEIIDLAPLM